MGNKLQKSKHLAKVLYGSSKRNLYSLFNLLKTTYGSNLDINNEETYIKKTEKFLNYKNTELNQEINYFFINKLSKINKNDDVLLLGIFCNDKSITEFQRKLIKFYKNEGFKVVLIIACNDTQIYNQNIDNGSHIEIIRDNIGYDFGSWSTAICALNCLSDAKSITFTNDSISPIYYEKKLLKKIKTRTNSSKKDIIFLIENREIIHHTQSYYFTFKRSAIKKGVLEFFKYDPQDLTKWDVIIEAELGMYQFLKKEGFSISTLYSYPEIKGNLSINHWDKLINSDFPFIKLKLFQLNILKINNPKLIGKIDPEVLKDIDNHLQKRVNFERKFIYKNVRERQVLSDLNYPPYFHQRPIQLDIKDFNEDSLEEIKFVCILHVFYVDIGISHIKKLESLKIPYRLIITTNTKQKKKQILSFCTNNLVNAEVNIHKNKGRDILPFLKELKNIGETNLPILHIHTKKSPHEKALKNWGDYSISNLISNHNNVLSVIKILQTTKIGIIYPDFPKIIKDRINWGYDFQKASEILTSFNIEIDVNDFLLFPAGSMMWLKYDAVKQLTSYIDEDLYDRENGQEDGTTAHAIERVFFHICKKNGYEYIPIKYYSGKTKSSIKKEKSMQVPTFRKINDLIEYCKKYLSPEFKRSIKGFLKENDKICYPVLFKKNDFKQSRINLLIPTLEPEKAYGGIMTAIKLFKEINSVKSYRHIRIIVITDSVSLKAVNFINKIFQTNFVIEGPNNEEKDKLFSILPLKSMKDRIIDIKDNDFYVASAWWTAELGFRIIDKQFEYFNNQKKLIYLIQDYEPIFYPNSSTSAIAKATYQNGSKTIGIINSEELYNFFEGRHKFHDCFYVPFELNEKLNNELLRKDNLIKRENIIICYGRPSTPRNCFELIKEGLYLWQQNDEKSHINKWKIYFIGEDFKKGLVEDLKNTKVLNKLPLEKYAKIMKKAKVGISLMESPHPSYPPLEMALFGVNVITNKFESKDLSIRSKNIINLSKTDPIGICQSLKVLTRNEESNSSINILGAPKCSGKKFDAKNFIN